MSKLGVILVNTGTPDGPEPEQVAAFLEQYLSHPRIVPMNKHMWNIILHKSIIPKRSVASAEKYRTIWTDEGFKFLRDHERLARKVEERYHALGMNVLVRCGMLSGNPGMKDVACQLHDEGCDDIVVIPLFPQNAFSQAGIAHDQVRELYKEHDWGTSISVVGDYSRSTMYRNALVQKVKDAGFDIAAGDRLLMSFHSIPLNDIENGDTYDVTSLETALAIAEALGIPDDQWMVAFQSRFDKDREWLSPFVNDILTQWADDGFDGRLFVLCPNFTVDCLETYYEVEKGMKSTWLGLIGQPDADDKFVYIPCMNDSDAHVDIIMNLLGI